MRADYLFILGALVAHRTGAVASSADIGHLVATTDLPDTCPWSPFGTQNLICDSSRANAQKLSPSIPAQQGNRTKTPTEAPAPPTWVGGRRCAGQYCLYAHRGFGQGRGIVVITDPASLEIIKRREADFDALYANEEARTSSYDVQEVQGKGLGVIAKKSLVRGDVLMTHAPVLLAHRGFVERTPKPEKDALFDFVPTLLPAATRRLFMRQVGKAGAKAGSASNTHEISDILTTNSFQMDIGGADGHHYGNFPEVSRFNHDCRPNAVFHVGQDLVHRTTVVRPLKPGEELTISYLDQMSPRAARQQRARGAWGFECSCSLCGASEEVVEESDGRISEIQWHEAALSDIKSKVTLDMVERYVSLLKKERLESKMFGPYTTAALNCNLLGKDKMAVEYAKLAIEAGMMENGPGASDVEAMRVLAADPKAHFTWRGRVKK